MTTPSTPAHTLHVDVVANFLEALQRSDLDAALALVAEDLTYINVSLATIHGRRGLDRLFRPLIKPGRAGFAVRVHHLATDGKVVLTDRTDQIPTGPVASGACALRPHGWAVCGRGGSRGRGGRYGSASQGDACAVCGHDGDGASCDAFGPAGGGQHGRGAQQRS